VRVGARRRERPPVPRVRRRLDRRCIFQAFFWATGGMSAPVSRFSANFFKSDLRKYVRDRRGIPHEDRFKRNDDPHLADLSAYMLTVKSALSLAVVLKGVASRWSSVFSLPDGLYLLQCETEAPENANTEALEREAYISPALARMRLADAHACAVDTRRKLLFITPEHVWGIRDEDEDPEREADTRDFLLKAFRLRKIHQVMRIDVLANRARETRYNTPDLYPPRSACPKTGS
jgi:hypothetical protein